ncbi:MAG: Ig-like domain-containing protein, partial [Deltaproteobacteria bacterium]|nr:Ig-like domain-containing protein [Deltaproteobacteria bacterium]
MDPDTITTATFTLTTGNDTISGSVSYEAGGFAVFTPDDDLSYATTYVATITTDVEDPFGYAMASEYTWDFTTTTILLDSDSKGCFISSARAE